MCFNGDNPNEYRLFYKEINELGRKDHDRPWEGLYCPPRGNVTDGAPMVIGLAPGQG